MSTKEMKIVQISKVVHVSFPFEEVLLGKFKDIVKSVQSIADNSARLELIDEVVRIEVGEDSVSLGYAPSALHPNRGIRLGAMSGPKLLNPVKDMLLEFPQFHPMREEILTARAISFEEDALKIYQSLGTSYEEAIVELEASA